MLSCNLITKKDSEVTESMKSIAPVQCLTCCLYHRLYLFHVSFVPDSYKAEEKYEKVLKPLLESKSYSVSLRHFSILKYLVLSYVLFEFCVVL